MKNKRTINGWPFVLPGLSFAVLITFGPIIYVLVQSFQRVRLYDFYNRPFIGLTNYMRVVNDVFITRSILITIYYTLLVTALCILVALAIGSLVNSKHVRNKNIVLTLCLIPFIVTQVVTGLMFRILIFEPTYGLLNNVINALANTRISTVWTMNPNTAFPIIVAVSVWRLSPLAILMIYTGLTTVPNQLVEAGRIDGAHGLQIFRNIIYPYLHKHVVFVSLILMTSAFREFDTVMALTGGGPGRQTAVLSIMTYFMGTQNHDYGIASAISVIMFVIIACLCLLYRRIFRIKGIEL